MIPNKDMPPMPFHSAIAVANCFIRKAPDMAPLAPCQIQFMVYQANAWTLAITGKPLIGELSVAGYGGPTFPSLRKAIASEGKRNISTPLPSSDRPIRNPFTPEKQNIEVVPSVRTVLRA